MWGTPGEYAPYQAWLRFIPTHVGNTPYPWQWAQPAPVHPHACGEHACGYDDVEVDSGSSPRMWGTRKRPHEVMVDRRFIPTHVGNTSALIPALYIPTVHPHACGEHSPPSCVGGLGIRFIPTHVGNTADGGELLRPAPVHPHACGEHVHIRKEKPRGAGSSPRMWGTRKSLLFSKLAERFIPTHVGNTPCLFFFFLNNAVHPHACGEHSCRV